MDRRDGGKSLTVKTFEPQDSEMPRMLDGLSLIAHDPVIDHTLFGLGGADLHLAHVGPEHGVPLGCRPHSLMDLLEYEGRGGDFLQDGHRVDCVLPSVTGGVGYWF